ncbi:hypothetical protein LTR49_028640 [Elasticomyces elasticus]|nr:hypothetical protein LTR49_028640 [Elasticomyces elasticus]
MNQTIHNQEYDVVTVCVTNVLEVHVQRGFRDPVSYPPILSSILEVARFMIIQQAGEMARPTGFDEQYSSCASAMDFGSDSDSEYDSPEQSPDRGPRRQTRDLDMKPITSFGWFQQMVRTSIRNTHLMSARKVV